MIRAGRMAEFEIVQTEADVASQELNVEESANQVDSARLALLQLLALDLSTQIRASDALAATPIEVDRQQAIRTALQQQPEYLQRLIGSRQADLNLVLAKNQRLWDVSLVGGASQIRDRYSEAVATIHAAGTATPGYRWKFPSATSAAGRPRCAPRSTWRTRRS